MCYLKDKKTPQQNSKPISSFTSWKDTYTRAYCGALSSATVQLPIRAIVLSIDIHACGSYVIIKSSLQNHVLDIKYAFHLDKSVLFTALDCLSYAIPCEDHMCFVYTMSNHKLPDVPWRHYDHKGLTHNET